VRRAVAAPQLTTFAALPRGNSVRITCATSAGLAS
jgi:hypothetical protein